MTEGENGVMGGEAFRAALLCNPAVCELYMHAVIARLHVVLPRVGLLI